MLLSYPSLLNNVSSCELNSCFPEYFKSSNTEEPLFSELLLLAYLIHECCSALIGSG